MKVVIFGATGMVGQGVLRQCLVDDRVTGVLVVGRRATGHSHAKLEEIVHSDFLDYAAIRDRLVGLDGCFFCLGVSSVGMKEPEYRRVTYDGAVAAATAVLSPQTVFVLISGGGADSTEKGSTMWARVKGAAENALLRMPFKATYVFRPGFIQPMHGVVSRTRLYRFFYILTTPLFPLLRWLFPRYVTTSERIGLAMIAAVERGAPKVVLENADINALA